MSNFVAEVKTIINGGVKTVIITTEYITGYIMRKKKKTKGRFESPMEEAKEMEQQIQ